MQAVQRDTSRAHLSQSITRIRESSNPSSQLLDSLVGSLLVAYSPSEVVTVDSSATCQAALLSITDLVAQGFLSGALSTTQDFAAAATSKFVVPASNLISTDVIDTAVGNLADGVFQSMVNGQTGQTGQRTHDRVHTLIPFVDSTAALFVDSACS
jgi:hypothetical protein